MIAIPNDVEIRAICEILKRSDGLLDPHKNYNSLSSVFMKHPPGPSYNIVRLFTFEIHIPYKLARDYIEEEAISLPCGTKCCSWCSVCYDRRCVKASYIIFAILMVGALFMSNVGVLGILPYSRSGSYKSTTCTVASAAYTGQTFKCGHSKCPANIACSTYPCLLMKVNYSSPGGTSREVPFYDTQWELFGRGESKICAIQPQNCNYNSNPTKDIETYVNTYGQVGSTLSCLYNPGDLNQVIRHRTQPRAFSLGMVGASGLLFIVGLVGLLVTAMSCGCHCKVMCSGKPPGVIRKKLSSHGAGRQ